MKLCLTIIIYLTQLVVKLSGQGKPGKGKLQPRMINQARLSPSLLRNCRMQLRNACLNRIRASVRVSHRPKDPQCLKEFEITGDWASHLYYDNGPEAYESIIIFCSPNHLGVLAGCAEWCMDGKFSVAPRLFTQLYVIQGRVDGVHFPLMYALLQRKTQTIYEQFFRILEESGCDPSSVIIDFEKPVEIALRVVFGEQVRVQFCFYHLSQSIWRQIQHQGLKNLYEFNNEFRLFCGQLDALAFLPPEDVKEGMAHLRSTMPEEAAPLLEYFSSTYNSSQLRHHQPVTSRPASCIKSLHLRRTLATHVSNREVEHAPHYPQ
ncbi:hypothetical protein E2C01_014845 [Portunus trituberculatus]|uniref:MULE transposase domain-containing protein n=1 Tax=Portunus trituberculatus TaxID=210409 RepID=A0A5B7DLD0_PORTR|nr:hypothetical protein [Portunus trituberculatus]